MDNTNRNFKGQMANEEVLCFCRKHWVVIIHYLVGLVILWAILFWLAFSLEKEGVISVIGETGYQTVAFIAIIIATFLHHRIFIRLLNYYLQIFVVTNYRLVEMGKTVFFRDSRNALDVKEIQDMVMKKDGLFRTILDYGDLEIRLSSVTEPYCIRYVPNPEYHFRKINKTKREYIVGRQLEKETRILGEEERYPERIIKESQVETIPQSFESN